MATMPFSPCPDTGPCTDQSIGILRHIFGPIIDVLVTGADPSTVSSASNILATMFTFFNSGILVVGSIIVSYVAAMGAVNTANDGEAMGKAWSSVWTPVRIVAGGAVLLPSASGYSFIQMLVLMISLWSVGFANGIYKLGMGMGLMKPDSIVATSTQPSSYFGLRDFAKQYLAASYCARAANTIYADPAGNPMVMANSSAADKQVSTGPRTDYTFFIKDRNAATNLGGGEPICGTVMLTAYSTAGTYTDTSGTQAALDALRVALNADKLAAATALMQDIDNWVATMPSDINQSGWDTVESKKFNSIVQARENQVAGNITAQMTGSTGAVNGGVSTFLTSLTDDGWAMAGGWYQRVGLLRSKLASITNESIGSVTQPSLSSLPSDARASLLKNSVTTVSETITKKAEQAGNGYDASTTVKPEDIASLLPKDGTSDVNVGSLANDMGVKLSRMVNGVMKSATDTVIGSSGDVDAISRMKVTGDILASYQVMLWTAQVTLETAMTATRVVVGAVGGVEVLGNKIDMSKVTDALWDWIMAVPIPILAKLASYVGVLAFYFGVVLPSLPYTIFMITVVGWVLAVLQTTIAAPLWAVMHMRPSQTFVGSDAQGYLLLLALFVRPALAVIGLFAAMLVADPVVDYIAKAFFVMRGDVTTSTGLLGAVAQFWTFFWWFTVFGGLLLPVLYMIFGLPQILPDRVLAWLNVGVHDLGATGAASQMQHSMAPQAARAGAESAERLGGGGRGGNPALGGPGRRGGSPGSGGGRGGGGYRNTPINANHQGVVPAVNEAGVGSSGGGSPGGRTAAGGGGGGGAAPARPLRRRFSDGAGVAIGRAITDSAMAVKDAAAEGRSGFVARAAGNLKQAGATVMSEGGAAYRQGADARIQNFRASMALRSAMSSGPSRPVATAPLAGATLAMAASGTSAADAAPAPSATGAASSPTAQRSSDAVLASASTPPTPPETPSPPATPPVESEA